MSSPRVATHLTGRASRRASQASRISSRYGPLLTPKPPPTSGAITRTCDSGRSRSRATSALMRNGAWHETQSVRTPVDGPSRASTERGSMATPAEPLLDRRGATRRGPSRREARGGVARAQRASERAVARDRQETARERRRRARPRARQRRERLVLDARSARRVARSVARCPPRRLPPACRRRARGRSARIGMGRHSMSGNEPVHRHGPEVLHLLPVTTRDHAGRAARGADVDGHSRACACGERSRPRGARPRGRSRPRSVLRPSRSRRSSRRLSGRPTHPSPALACAIRRSPGDWPASPCRPRL